MMLQTKCGVRQSWATCFFLVHLGCLRLGVLEPWLRWNGLGLHLEGLNHMIIWYLLEMVWPYTWKACILWTFGPWCWSCEYTFDGLKWWAKNDSRDNFWFPYKVEYNHRPLGLSSFIAYKVQTIMMGSSVGLESSWFKQRPNKCIMKCNLIDQPKGRFYGSLQHG